MLKVHCAGCNAPYEVDPRRIPKGGMKMRCPACDATFKVTPDGGVIAAPKAPPPPPPSEPQASDDDPFGVEMPTLGGLDLDMPGPSQGGNFGGGDMFADLPAPKGHQDDLELDLPAPKGHQDPAPKRPAHSPPAPRARDDLELDLPTPKSPGPKHGHADLPAPRGAARADEADLPAPARSKLAPDFGADLPAPKVSPAQPGTPRAAAPPRPAPVSPGPPPSAGSPRKSFSKPGVQRTGPVEPKPASAGAPPAQRPPAPEAPAAPRPRAGAMPKDSLAIDPEPFFASGADALVGLDDPTAGAPGTGSRPAVDLPAPRSRDFDLPAPKIRTRDADLPAPKRGQGSQPPEVVDLPAAKGHSDLPGLSQKGPHADLPAVKPSGAPAGDDGVDLPGLPGLRDDGVDLPTRSGRADLPAVKSSQTPKPPAGSDLASRLRAAGELPPDEPPPAAAPPAGKKLPKDSLDIESFKAMGGELPSPFDLDDAASRPEAGAVGEGSRTSAALSQGLKLPSSGTGVQPEPEPPPPKRSPSLPSLLDDSPDDPAQAGALDLDLGEAPPPLELDAPEPAPDAGADLDDLFGEPLEGGSAAPSLDDDPFGLGDPADPASGHGGHEPLELGGDLDAPLDLRSAPPRGPSAGPADLGDDFDLGEEPLARHDAPPPPAADVPLDYAGSPPQRRKPRDLGMTLDLDEPEDKKEKKPVSIPPAVWILAVVVLFIGTGIGLGQTKYGLFGVYLIERFLPEAGDPKVVAQDIEAAEARASSDTYVDVRKSLRMLSDARMSAGLSHPLLSRSLLHEGLFRLRFGPNNSSAQRSVAILSRLRERTNDAPGMRIAVAADLAARGKLDEARTELKRAGDGQDPYAGLVGGEVWLLSGKPKQAVAEFEKASKRGGAARASFGVARAKLAAGDLEGAKAAIELTLQLSPLHAAAHVQRGAWALSEKRLDAAERDLLQATGWREVNGKRIRASQATRAEAWTLLGKLYEERDYIGRALAAYDRALEADALVMDALLGSGRTLLQLSRPREALSRFKSALQAKPSAKAAEDGSIPIVVAKVGAAQALLRIDESDKAIGHLQNLPKPLDDHPDVTLWLGHAHEQKGEFEFAEQQYRKSIENAPTQFAGYLALAQMMFSRKRPEEAAKTLDAAKEQVDDGADVRRMLGQSELSRNHIGAARAQFEAALKYRPEDTGALFGLAVTQRREGELDEAMATLDRVEKLDPKFPALSLERGRIHEARGHYEEAVEVYEKALAQREGDIDLQLQLGSALVAAGDLDRAEELLRAVLKVRPTSAEAEHFIGRVVFARKDSAQAVVHFERAVNLDVTNARFHMYLAWASLESGNFAGALESIEKSIDRDHTLGDAHWIKGRIQLRMGAVKDAIASFTEALKLSPGRTEAYADMGDAYEQLRKLRSAVNAYEAAVERDASRGDWWYRLGSLRLDRGKRDDAMTALSEAVILGDRMEAKPDWLADAHRIYADILRAKGQDDRALEHYNLYLELAPSHAMDRPNVQKIVADLRR